MGKVYLTGAGPGDIDLLTVKALRIIRQADVIIYDRLANPDILSEAKDGCEFIYVGKEDSHHTLPQEEINEVIYQSDVSVVFGLNLSRVLLRRSLYRSMREFL